MYQKYQTEAIVLATRESGEADKSFALYTREFGLVRARATAVRAEKSKMRSALQLFARANVALVRGKSGWRLAGAHALAGFAGDDLKSIGAFARIAELTVRLVAGEERNDYLYDALTSAHETLTLTSVEAVPMVEIVAVARVLYALGYISSETIETDHASFSAENVRDPASHRRAPALRRGPIPVSLFTHTMYAPVHLDEASTMREALLSSINRALGNTHL